MRLLAIDPGRDTGWAMLEDKILVKCGLGDPRRAVPSANAIIELPQVYRASNSKGDPNDLIKVAVQVGEYKGWIEYHGFDVTLVKPADWKGQVPKDVHHKRIQHALSTDELEVIKHCMVYVTPSKQHNVLDAVALGLFGVGRVRVGGVVR